MNTVHIKRTKKKRTSKLRESERTQEERRGGSGRFKVWKQIEELRERRASTAVLSVSGGWLQRLLWAGLPLRCV